MTPHLLDQGTLLKPHPDLNTSSIQKCVSACSLTLPADGLEGPVYLATTLLFFMYSFCVFELLEEVVPGRLLFATCMPLCFFVAQQLQSLYLVGTWDWQAIVWPCLGVGVLVCVALQWRPGVWSQEADRAKPAKPADRAEPAKPAERAERAEPAEPADRGI